MSLKLSLSVYLQSKTMPQSYQLMIKKGLIKTCALYQNLQLMFQKEFMKDLPVISEDQQPIYKKSLLYEEDSHVWT